MSESKFEPHLLCGIKVISKILAVWKERIINQLRILAAAGADAEALQNL